MKFLFTLFIAFLTSIATAKNVPIENSLKWIKNNTSLEIPSDFENPEIKIVNINDDALFAYFEVNSNTIVFNSKNMSNRTFSKSVLIHELIHCIQISIIKSTGKNRYKNEEAFEKEAYFYQYKFLKMSGEKFDESFFLSKLFTSI